MLRFLAKKPVLGIEITASQIRLAVLSGKGENRSVLFTKTVELPGGMVNESYSAPNIGDVGQFADTLREALSVKIECMWLRLKLPRRIAVFK